MKKAHFEFEDTPPHPATTANRQAFKNSKKLGLAKAKTAEALIISSKQLLPIEIQSGCHAFISCKPLVRAVGLEPTRPFGLQILSLVCLPFHHARNAPAQ